VSPDRARRRRLGSHSDDPRRPLPRTPERGRRAGPGGRAVDRRLPAARRRCRARPPRCSPRAVCESTAIRSWPWRCRASSGCRGPRADPGGPPASSERWGCTRRTSRAGWAPRSRCGGRSASACRAVTEHRPLDRTAEQRPPVRGGPQVLVGIDREVLDANQAQLPARGGHVEQDLRPPQDDRRLRGEGLVEVVKALARCGWTRRDPRAGSRRRVRPGRRRTWRLQP
jgi:hypothetical protein